MARQLDETILDGGIRNAHFFNGRWLTAEDLRTEQEANREHHRQLGSAIGEGVVNGLEVELVDAGSGGRPPRVKVSAGLALNRRGETLVLTREIELSLTQRAEEISAEAGLFAPCDNPTGDLILTGAGAWVLAACPASGFRERAPGRELGDERSLAGCGSRYAVEGVRFRMVRLPLAGDDPVRGAIRNLLGREDAEGLSLARNLLAHLCLRASAGAVAQARLRRGEPPAFAAAASALDDLRETGGLGDGDVALALLRWDNRGIRFVDRWAVRRVARWRPADLSLLAADGLERLLQFLDHLRDITRPPAPLPPMRIERFFRFVPPAAYLPITGAGSPRGLSPSGFLQAFTTGQPDRLPAGLAAELLERSFRQPPVDLAGRQVLQAFRIDENVAAVAADRSDQLYLLFANRSLEGPNSRDGVALAFEDAWNAYRGLIRRRMFLPLNFYPHEEAFRITVLAAERDVADVATRQAARAAAFSLDVAAALEAFRQFHAVQRELSILLSSDHHGIPDIENRIEFGRALTRLLDQQLSGGDPGLLPAVNSGDLLAAVRAQEEINRFVGSWSGEGVAVGPFSLQHLSSPDGPVLVPGEDFRHRFILINSTDRRLTFHLEVSTLAPRGDWQGSTTLHRESDGAEISEIDLDSAGQATLEARIHTPETAVVRDTAVLTLSASIGPPNNRTQQINLSLPIERTAGDPVPRRITFEPIVQEPPDPEHALPNSVLTYLFNMTYTAEEGPALADFLFVVEVNTDPVQTWIVAIDTASELADNPAPGRYERRIEDVRAGEPRQVQVIFRTPSAAGSTATFHVHADSIDLEPAFSGSHPDSLQIRVQTLPPPPFFMSRPG